MMVDQQLPFAVLSTNHINDLHAAGRPTRAATRKRS